MQSSWRWLLTGAVKIRRLILTTVDRIEGLCCLQPEVCFNDARQYLRQVLERRSLEPESVLALLERMSQLR